MLRFISPIRLAAFLAAGCSLINTMPAGAQGLISFQESAGLVGNAVGPKALDAMVSVAGEYGSPQPKAWDFSLVDPAGEGGVRALRATGRRTVQRLARSGGYESGVPLGFFRWSDVKVDSTAAFQAADQEARGAMVGFDSVHYLLRAREGTAQPVWFLSLWDSEERTVGRLEISATTGKVERRVWLRYLGYQDVPAKVEDSLSPYASMRPSPPPPPVQLAPPPFMPVPPPVEPLAPGIPVVPPPPPEFAPVVPPLPDNPAPPPEPTPGYTPLPN